MRAGQGFAQARRTKAIREYKKLLQRTRKQQQQRSSYVETIYSNELSQDTTFEDLHQKKPQRGEESKSELSMKVFDKKTKKIAGEGTNIFQGIVNERIKEPLGVVVRTEKPVGVVEESTDNQRKSLKTVTKKNTKIISPKPNSNKTKTPSTLNKQNLKRQNKSRYTQAQRAYHVKKVDTAKSQKERQQQRDKKLQEIQASQEKRRQTYLQFSKRTRKGQPVMSSQINHLLSKLKADY